MTIDPLSTARPLMAVSDQESISLQQRVADTAAASSLPDADVEALYQALIHAGADFDAYGFLKEYTGADGECPFRTSGKQQAALQHVMTRLREEGREGDPAYTFAKEAFSKAFSMNFMVQGFMNAAMSPSDDEDSRENVEW